MNYRNGQTTKDNATVGHLPEDTFSVNCQTQSLYETLNLFGESVAKVYPRVPLSENEELIELLPGGGGNAKEDGIRTHFYYALFLCEASSKSFRNTLRIKDPRM